MPRGGGTWRRRGFDKGRWYLEEVSFCQGEVVLGGGEVLTKGGGTWRSEVLPRGGGTLRRRGFTKGRWYLEETRFYQGGQGTSFQISKPHRRALARTVWLC